MQRRQQQRQQQAASLSGGGSGAQPAGSASAQPPASGGAVDRDVLKQQLVRVLQWDPFAAEGVVAAVEGAGSQQEVEDLVELGFMGGSLPAREAVLRFWQSSGAGSADAKAQAAAPAGSHVHRKQGEVARAPAQAAAGARGGGAGSSGGGGGGPSRPSRGGSAPSGGVELPAPSQPVAAKDGGKVPDFGVNIRTTVKKGKSSSTSQGGGPLTAARLERPVVNCLSCGRIFDCRAVTNDTIQFLESGGICTFCGNQVALRYADGTPVPAASVVQEQPQSDHSRPAGEAQPAAAARVPAAAAANGSTTANGAQQQLGQQQQAQQQQPLRELSEGEVAALELKNRLVDYDRNSAKRTVVIDDQSDFFEIDSNAWLNDEERAQLKQRQRELQEAEEARRRRVTVTIDLLGRKVLLDDNTEAAKTEPAARAAAEAAVQAAKATAEELPQGGGSAAQAALERAEEALRSLRICVNPSLAAANYVFLPTAAAPPPAAAEPRGTAGAASHGARRVGANAGEGDATPASMNRSRDMAATHAPRGGNSTGGGAAHGQGRRRSRQQQGRGAADAPPRLQHDDPFQLDIDTAVEVLAEDESSRAALEQSMDEAQQGPFDLCPPVAPATMRPLGPPAGRAGGASRQREGSAGPLQTAAPRVEVLQEGMVLLRGWLSLAQQAEAVGAIRALGLGPGGFYTPSYSNGSQLALRMMGLGLHWEPRTPSYEETRSSHDGARPPPIPAFLLDLVQRCMSDAQTAPGVGNLPPIRPNICLCNFYEKQGRLGLHQDKDESPESLKAGIPVVSFSIGDATDFAYGPSRDESCCQVVRLESGDALVFGGPSRMVYHAVRAVHGGTAPAELVQRTNLRPGRLNLTFRQT